MDLQYYLNYTKTNLQQTDLQEMSDKYSEQWDSAISSFDIVINSSRADKIYKDDIEYKCLVDFNRKNGKNDFTPTIYRELRTKLSDNFKSGDFVEFENPTSKEKNFFLLIKHVESKEGYDLFYMQECNVIFTYQDYNDNNKIIKIPAINTSATLYSDGIDNNKYFSESDDLLNVLVPYSEYIYNLELQRRFIFNNKKIYKLTMINDSDYFNSISKTGLLKMTLKRDNKNLICDRLDLNIADYRENTSPTPSIGYSIEIQGSNECVIDYTESYTAIVKFDNVEVDNKKVVWSLEGTNAQIQSFDELSCIIKGLDYGEINLVATLFDNNAICDKRAILIKNIF